MGGLVPACAASCLVSRGQTMIIILSFLYPWCPRTCLVFVSVCLLPMGVYSEHMIKDNQLTAESSSDKEHVATAARLSNNK